MTIVMFKVVTNTMDLVSLTVLLHVLMLLQQQAMLVMDTAMTDLGVTT